MTISNINPPVTRYSGNGATTAFATVFVFNLSSELVVTLTDSSGTDTVQTITTHYTVSGGNNSTGTVTFLTAPASGYTVTIERVTPLTQSVDYVENDSFPAETHEGALDKLTRIVQEMDYANRRALLYSATSGIVDLELPNPESGYFLRWNSTEDGLENATVADVGSYVFGVGTGILTQTAALTSTVRTLTGTANQIVVTDGDGVAGNPTFGFDSTVRLTDSALEVVDNGDATKKLKFELSGVTTATTRTLTIPDKSGTIAMTSDIDTEAQYVTLDTSSSLANERVLTAGTGISITDAGAGSTVTVANTGLAGQVLQVVESTLTTATTTTSSTHSTILTVNITPSSSSNKILILTKVNLSVNSTSTMGSIRIQRNGTTIGAGDNSTSRIPTGSGISGANMCTDAVHIYLDSPASTSSVTYTVQVASTDNTTGIGINRQFGTDSNTSVFYRALSSITVLEIKG